mgnify:CR=1 FL=1
MIIYSDSFYIGDNGNGYNLDVRDVICSNCHNIIDRQEKYRGIDKDYKFSNTNKSKWKNCPYCGKFLYEEE